MNKKQQAVIWMGMAFLTCAALYVPYDGVYVREGDNLRNYMGYRFFFQQPTQTEVYHVVFNRSPQPESYLNRCHAEIVTERIWVEMAAIGLVTSAATAALASKKT